MFFVCRWLTCSVHLLLVCRWLTCHLCSVHFAACCMSALPCMLCPRFLMYAFIQQLSKERAHASFSRSTEHPSKHHAVLTSHDPATHLSEPQQLTDAQPLPPV